MSRRSIGAFFYLVFMIFSACWRTCPC